MLPPAGHILGGGSSLSSALPGGGSDLSQGNERDRRARDAATEECGGCWEHSLPCLKVHYRVISLKQTGE